MVIGCSLAVNKWLLLQLAIMEVVTLHNKQFAPFIDANKIDLAIKSLAENINKDYQGKEVLFVGVLNGAFRFIADLIKYIDLKCEVSFVKMASYEGVSTTGAVKQLIGFNEDIENRHLIIVEDIVDSGNTLVKIMDELDGKNVASVKIATLLFKPEAYKKDIEVSYKGLEIPNDFIVGYGLDYDGLGRELNHIYKIV